MAINKDKNISVSVVLDKDFHSIVVDLANKNKRSVSMQVAFMAEEYYKLIKNNKWIHQPFDMVQKINPVNLFLTLSYSTIIK